MATNSKTQTVFSHDNGIIVGKRRRPNVVSARRHPSVKFVYQIIAKFRSDWRKSHFVDWCIVDSSHLATEFRVNARIPTDIETAASLTSHICAGR